MMFVYTSEVEALFDDPILAVLSNRIGVLLTGRPGYQCKDFMLSLWINARGDRLRLGFASVWVQW